MPTYQRDYKWELKHLQELPTDVQEAFLSSWKPAHGRKDVLGYESYFLGTIITTLVGQGGKAIVDGQQRITTLTLLLSYVHRLNTTTPGLGLSPVDQTIRRRVAGQNEFNLDMDAPRKALFDMLIDGPGDEDDLAAQIESIPDMDMGTERLWQLYQHIEKSLAEEIKSQGLLPHFFDYLTECVCMFEIGVPKEQDGHKVFVTMNDRGLKLSPVDLLKGFLLSSISSTAENQAAHEKWNEGIRKLQALGSDEDSNFFKTWLRAKYGNSSRGKNRGDAPGDFELIGDSYHRWVIDNKDRMGLKTSDDFSNFLTGSLPYFVDLYCKIKSGERQFDESQPHVFFNGARDFTLQSMVVLSVVKATDTTSDATKKVRAVSYFLDYLATVRVVNGKENTYDNVRDIVFDLTKEIRDLDLPELQKRLVARIDSEKDKIDSIKLAGYDLVKRQDLLQLLARLADYLERQLDATNRVGFQDYVDRTRDSRTFDIEHLIANDLTAANADIAKSGKASSFSSQSEFIAKRNNIGGLILLPRGRNRSMKDMPYSEKLGRYAAESMLAQTLTESFYQNQPNWTKFVSTTGINAAPIGWATGDAIDSRAALYQAVAAKIWSKEELELLFK